jgi:hypothetical protein
MGGIGVWSRGYYSLVYKNLAPHYQIQLSMNLIYLDTIDKDDFGVFVDNEIVYEVHDVTLFPRPINLYGGIFVDYQERKQFNVAHTSSTIDISLFLYCSNNAFDESMAVNDYIILINKVKKYLNYFTILQSARNTASHAVNRN